MASKTKPRRSHLELASDHVDFRSRIGRMIKASNSSATKIAKDELNSLANILGLKLAHNAVKLVVSGKIHTIKSVHIMGAAKILLPNILWEHVVKKGAAKMAKSPSKEMLEKLELQPARVRKLIQMHAQGIRISSSAVLVLAYILAETMKEFIEGAASYARNNKLARINAKALFETAHHDQDFKELFVGKLKVTFAGGGVKRHIPQHYKPEKGQKGASKINRTNKKIKHYQDQTECFSIRKLPFERVVREALQDAGGHDVRLSEKARTALQYFVEDQVVKMLHDANDNAHHASRIIVQKRDIELAAGQRRKHGLSPVY